MLAPVKTCPPGTIAVIPRLVPAVVRHNTVPIGKSPPIRAWVTSKIVPVGQAPGIGLDGRVDVGVGLGEVLLFVV
jgi:hypothetical protein